MNSIILYLIDHSFIQVIFILLFFVIFPLLGIILSSFYKIQCFITDEITILNKHKGSILMIVYMAVPLVYLELVAPIEYKIRHFEVGSFQYDIEETNCRISTMSCENVISVGDKRIMVPATSQYDEIMDLKNVPLKIGIVDCKYNGKRLSISECSSRFRTMGKEQLDKLIIKK